jgi:hypothetical protein
MSRLELKRAERQGGRGKIARIFLDFVVDGRSLYDLVGHQFDTVSCLAQWPDMEETQKALNRLLLLEPADFPDNRRSLYVCGECGGLDCGAVSIIIEEEQDTITWHTFGYERDWEDNLEELKDIGPFVFGKAQYTQTLKRALNTLPDARDV